uniref:Uncharacterized protein n=1 Tax=Rhizophora mucronata TaxID=61149 RepID=A0A2P2JFN9_RHIMU
MNQTQKQHSNTKLSAKSNQFLSHFDNSCQKNKKWNPLLTCFRLEIIIFSRQNTV